MSLSWDRLISQAVLYLCLDVSAKSPLNIPKKVEAGKLEAGEKAWEIFFFFLTW